MEDDNDLTWKDLLLFIPGVKIPFMIAEYVRGMRRLEQSYGAYQDATRQCCIFELDRLEAQRRTADSSQLLGIDEQIDRCRSLYAKNLIP